MPRYRVDIDGEVYEGSHPSMPAAVFSATLKLLEDFNKEWPWERRQREDPPPHPGSAGKWLIGVEELPAHRGQPRGKMKRVRTRQES